MSDTGPPLIPEYRLRLDVEFEDPQWDGSVEFDQGPGRDEIELDSEDLEIRSVTCNGEPVDFDFDARRHRLRIPLTASSASTVRVAFHGKLDPHPLVGLYRCRHGDGYVLTTQCEPIGARRIFPCVDRPDCKARVLLTVSAPAELEVVSNTEAERVRPVERRREWTFAPTPPMATYLFYLAVGEFDTAEDRSGRVPVRVLASPGRGESGRFAAEAAARILRAYETYYDIPYPLSKLDIVAVSEHSFGAMENWGAMSFRDMRLLIDGASPSNAQTDVFETLSHEIAHQWFGNLVTMAWWDDIWLNESFATFLEAKLTDRIVPEYDPFSDFVHHAWGMREALACDSLVSTHPVKSPVTGPEEIGQITDEITYGKGASVLRMLDAYLGEELFRRGVTDYLNRHRYRNARTEDLWAALSRSSTSDVSSVIDPWIRRPGLPVVAAELRPTGLHLTQHRFLFDGWRDEPPWPIPLVLDVDGHRESVLFDTRERIVPVPPSATVHLNPGGVGFYRVRYDPGLYDRLFAALPARPPLDRWIVLNDLGAFVVSGDVEWADYARFARALGMTRDWVVVEQLTFDLVNTSLALPAATRIQEFARSYLADLTESLGLDRRPGEPARTGTLRERVLRARVRLDAGFARELSERFVGWERLDPDLRAAVAIARARTEGTSAYREMRRALERPIPEVEALRLEVGLAWSGEPALVESTLEFTTSGAFNRGHVARVVGQAAANPVGRPVVGPWLEQSLPLLAQTFRGSSQLSALLEETIPYTGLGHSGETAAFFRDHPFPEAARGIAKGLERLGLIERLGARLRP